MRLATPFDPIEIGEIDNFAFDFTADMGAATMVSTSWTCASPVPDGHRSGAAVTGIVGFD